MANPIITVSDKRAKPLNVGGFSITVLASESDTDGYEIFHSICTYGKGPGPHYHPWDESLYITKGQVHCGVDEEEILASKGTLIHIPAGSVHWFRFGKEGGEFISITSKGNASKMFTAFSQGVNWESRDREELIKLAAEHGQVVID
jgi:quercetin dioxygenase-like cupin family protein